MVLIITHFSSVHIASNCERDLRITYRWKGYAQSSHPLFPSCLTHSLWSFSWLHFLFFLWLCCLLLLGMRFVLGKSCSFPFPHLTNLNSYYRHSLEGIFMLHWSFCEESLVNTLFVLHYASCFLLISYSIQTDWLSYSNWLQSF